MFNYIKGIVEGIELTYIVIENNNIGYQINSSTNTISDLRVGKDAKIYTRMIVREDDISLCGFSTKEELKMFDLLTSVSKIGPKVALSILSFSTPVKLSSFIINEDIGNLSKAPGIGKKTAERIILELKDKVDRENISHGVELSIETTNFMPQNEAVEALVALGYSLVESREAVEKCAKQNEDLEGLIKKSLGFLASK